MHQVRRAITGQDGVQRLTNDVAFLATISGYGSGTITSAGQPGRLMGGIL